MKKIFVLLLTLGSVAFANNAAELVKKNCTACHILTKPTQQQKAAMKAPPMPGVMFHLKEKIKDEEKLKAFIVDYIQHPAKEKAICMPRKIQRFGLMPSLKDVLTATELQKVAQYLYDNFPPAGFQHPKEGKMSKTGGKQQSPFLINGKMPHLTKLVKMHWDTLNLTDKQQEELLKIRKETIMAVKTLKPKILQLENEVATAVTAGETPDKLKEKVSQIADLKAKATMVHIKCIYNTKNILSKQQLQQLLTAE